MNGLAFLICTAVIIFGMFGLVLVLCFQVKGGDPLARYLYYKKTCWKRKLKGWNGSQAKGGERRGNTNEKPTEQEGSEAIHQREREVYHSSGIDLLHPFGTENQEHDTKGHSE